MRGNGGYQFLQTVPQSMTPKQVEFIMREQITLNVCTDWLNILIVHYTDGATFIYCTRHHEMLIKFGVCEMKPTFIQSLPVMRNNDRVTNSCQQVDIGSYVYVKRKQGLPTT